MPSDPVASLSELELDALWTLYEGHSLVVERPGGTGSDASAHVVMSVAYDEAGEAVAEVVEVELSTFAALLERGHLERSDDGPVLDAHRWFDDHLGVEVVAEEYLLSELGKGVIDVTSDESAGANEMAEPN